MATAPTKTTPAKAAEIKAEDKPTETKVAENKSTDVAVVEPVADDVVVESRTPKLLEENTILGSFCQRYLDILDEIAAYNKAVLAERDDEWSPAKLVEQARKFASPDDAKNIKPEIKNALDKWESLISEATKAKKLLLEATANELGIKLTNTAERDQNVEAPLKEKRKIAFTIGSQLSQIAEMTNDPEASNAVLTFLSNNPLPVIGRDQVRAFGNESGGSTPKYRVTITITNKDGQVLLTEDGFTKTAAALSKPVFNYERGKSPKSDVLRAAWEKAGNSPEKTTVNPVEFDDNDLHYVISKK